MKQFVVLFLFLSLSIQAQFQISGVVKDVTTTIPLPFASISSSLGANTIADADGKFILQSNQFLTEITVSYIGYSPKKISIEPNKTYYQILIFPTSSELNEVIVTNKNPANSIIRNVIKFERSNNPEKKLKSFQFKAYNKLIVTANPDSIDGRIDSVFIEKNNKKQLSKIDSSDFKFKKIISKQHLFQTEKISKFQYNENGLKETVLATKMAGFKQPIYEVLAFNLQSFSIYDKQYELFETRYISPISKEGLSNYNYKILDTVSIEERNTLMIYFKNKKRKNAAGLEGVLYIDQNNYAVAKAIMRIKGVLDITGTHELTYMSK